MTFNYNDHAAVATLAKKVLTKNEFPCSEGNVWLAEDEAAWHGYCTNKEGNYTPFPDLTIQPDNVKSEFAENEEGIESIPEHIPENSLHKDLMVAPAQVDRATGKLKTTVAEMDQPEPKRSKPGAVNFGIMSGSMSRFDNAETSSDRINLMAPNKPMTDGSTAPLKQPAQVHAKNADGKPVEPGKDILEKVSDLEFDSSHPSDSEIAQKRIEAAPEHTDLSSKEGTDEEKRKKDEKMEHRNASVTQSISTR